MTINIAPRVRFWLYISGAVAAPLIAYLNAVGTFGAPEVTLGTSYVALLGALAAAKTDLSEPNSRPVRPVEPEGY